MPNKNPDLLNPDRFTLAIKKREEFQSAMPRRPEGAADTSEYNRRKDLAIKLGSRAVANEQFNMGSGHELDANLFTMASDLNAFYDSQISLDKFHRKHDHKNRRDIPDGERDQFKANKEIVTNFNHTVKEVINEGAAKFDFNELVTFMTNMHVAMNGNENTKSFHEMARTAVIGMRNEIAFEQILMALDIDYELGTEEEDARGGDFIIGGERFDVKSSNTGVKTARDRASNAGHTARILWSQVNFEDFSGKLSLTYDTVQEIAPYANDAIAEASQEAENRAKYQYA